MKQLTEQDALARIKAWQDYANEYATKHNHIWPFEHGFVAGLEYRQARIEQLEAALKRIEQGNPARVGKWLTDIQMAEIARDALGLPERLY